MKLMRLISTLLFVCASAFGAIPLTYDLPEAGQVSHIVRNDSNIVRELPHAAQRDAGEHTDIRDGLEPGVVIIPYLDVRRANIDGHLKEWEGIEPLKILDGDELLANIYLGWSRHGLWAAFDVFTDTPWKSASTIDLAFQGGAAVDLNIGPIEPDRTQAIPGDVRYVAAPIGNNNRLVEMMPLLPPGIDDRQRNPVTYETDNGRITFDRVDALNNNLVAVRQKEDGTGYIVEMRVPLPPPLMLRPGERFRLDASLILADQGGTHSVFRIPWHSTSSADRTTNDTYFESVLRPQNWGVVILDCMSAFGAIPLTYDLPEAGQVSIIIRNDRKIVRELLHGAARDAGEHTEIWDGLDEAGQPVAAGDYTWKLLLTQGLHAEYMLTLGTNPFPEYATWPGNHQGVWSVHVDSTGAYIGGGGEGTVMMVKQDLDEKRLWTIPRWLEAWQYIKSMTSDKDRWGQALGARR